MSYSEDLKLFTAAHTYENMTVDGSKFRYVLSGKKGGKILVLLNGGMNTLEMWMGYVDSLAADYQVLLFDYPQELRTNQELVKGMHAFLKKSESRSRFLLGQVTEVWLHRFIHRSITERLAD